MPTVAELNQAAPETPVFVLYLYSMGFVNEAAVKALGWDQSPPPNPDGGRFEWIDGGAILHAEPNPLILYQMIARPPQLSEADQINSTLHFYREMNRLGLTSAIDAGGGGQNYPDDYAVIQKLREHDWNVSETARVVDMPRSNLYKKIEKYELVRED